MRWSVTRFCGNVSFYVSLDDTHALLMTQFHERDRVDGTDLHLHLRRILVLRQRRPGHHDHGHHGRNESHRGPRRTGAPLTSAGVAPSRPRHAALPTWRT